MATKKKSSAAASKNKKPVSMTEQVANNKKATKTAKDKKAAHEKAEKILVKIVDNVARFGLPYGVGAEKEIESKQAMQLVDLGYAVLAKEDADLEALKKKLGLSNDAGDDSGSKKD